MSIGTFQAEVLATISLAVGVILAALANYTIGAIGTWLRKRNLIDAAIDAQVKRIEASIGGGHGKRKHNIVKTEVLKVLKEKGVSLVERAAVSLFGRVGRGIKKAAGRFYP